MNRIKSAVEQYNKRKNRNKGNFTAMDIYAIYEMAAKDPAGMAIIGLKAGYMIGYRSAKREMHK